ncbi:MAG TPA: hypothetical protein VJ110_02105 [Candidatus Nanoarchaeia archaeon]|nr:hypothetical protein [Candidatus Nanoarchaeia archaeon]
MVTASLEDLIRKHGIPAHLIDREDAEERWNSDDGNKETERDNLQYAYEFWEPWVKDLEEEKPAGNIDINIYGEARPITRWPNPNWQFNAECVASAYVLGFPVAMALHEGLHYLIGLGTGAEVSGFYYDGLAISVRIAPADKATGLIGLLTPGYVSAGIAGTLLRGAKNASVRAGVALAFLADAATQMMPSAVQSLWTDKIKPLSDTYMAAHVVTELPYNDVLPLTAIQLTIGTSMLLTAVAAAYSKEIAGKIKQGYSYIKSLAGKREG